MKFLIVFLSTLIVGISSQLVLPKYPDVVPLAKFDVQKILGPWHVYAAIPNAYEPAQSCNNLLMSLNYDGSIQFSVSFLNRLTGAKNTWAPVGYPIPGGLPSQFNIKMPPLAYQRDTVGSVLDTDYNSFALIELIQITEKGILQYVWLVTRSPTPNEACLNSAFAALARNNIKATSLEIIPQKPCPAY
ncbi:hypothetical protein HCN44_005291 [Aphidius gifuensis]|uniref:Lipocalin/cytosolic fatty-acid binding domain-containing protein n=1 Tax=Aphidius gifuensis TaxID=684658 RepID=A0A834Y4G4_APHGI|nr:uncharacterized protein LOC122856165 [Aphidius gifuensis]KAF7997014.1 hypothetical protein HCN44_005291 [Aphidius gifuensis]